jgi:putative addiction module component (TIGR02574 family)
VIGLDDVANQTHAREFHHPQLSCGRRSVDEQIDYVQSLWDRIAATPEQVPIPDWHREVLDERLKDYEANPDAGESWDVVRERLRDKLRQRQ